MRYIRPENRAQYVMLNTLDDLVPSEHQVRLIDMVIDQMVNANPEQFGIECDWLGHSPHGQVTDYLKRLIRFLGHLGRFEGEAWK